MQKKATKLKHGLTVVELIMTLAVGFIVLSVVGFVMADGYRSWQDGYSRIYSDVFMDSFVARRHFDALVRRASSTGISIDPNAPSLKVYYYANDDSTFLDRYACFFLANATLQVEYGQIDAQGLEAATDIRTVCQNVSSLQFSQAGRSAQMILTLDNGRQSGTILSSAVAHN